MSGTISVGRGGRGVGALLSGPSADGGTGGGMEV